MFHGSLPQHTPPRTRFVGPRWSVISAALGAVLWLAAPLVPAGSPPLFGTIEHVFVFMPLVAAPLALLLVSALLEPEDSKSFFSSAARHVQPVASALVLASFFVPQGPLAAGLTAAWLGMTLMLALGGVRRAIVSGGAHLSNVSLLAALLFLPVGAVWLSLSRWGVGPRNFAALTVFLAAVHFHFSGFTLQILIAATGRQLEQVQSRLGAMHRGVAIAAIAGIPLIAAGNIGSSPALKFVGVACVVLGTLSLAGIFAAVGFALRAGTPRQLLFVSAASIAAGMVLAGIYGVGELSGAGSIGIPRMVVAHGLLNAVGFTLSGLIAHLLLRRETSRDDVQLR